MSHRLTNESSIHSSVCYKHTLVLLMFHSVLDNKNNGSLLHWPESGIGVTLPVNSFIVMRMRRMKIEKKHHYRVNEMYELYLFCFLTDITLSFFSKTEEYTWILHPSYRENLQVPCEVQC